MIDKLNPNHEIYVDVLRRDTNQNIKRSAL